MDVKTFTRFMEKARKLPNGCWYWEGAKSVKGYGRFRIGNKIVQPHRAAYEHFVGPIPEGLTIDHKCRHPWCVNWEHMEAVPLAENNRRGESPSARNERATRCIRGHEFTVENTVYYSRGGRGCRRCLKIRNAGYRKSTKRK